MDKKKLTEQEIRTRFILPSIQSAGWAASQIREDYAITKGRIIARSGACNRDEKSIKRADYILFLADRNALIEQTYINDFAPFKDIMHIVRNRKVDKLTIYGNSWTLTARCD